MHYEKNETEDIEEVLTDMQGNAEQKKAKRIVIVLMSISIMRLQGIWLSSSIWEIAIWMKWIMSRPLWLLQRQSR